MNARLLLVRHGESTWNAARRWQGQADPPLSERGEHQAASAAERLTALGPFDAVVTSGLRRARRTGELLAHHAGIVLGTAFDGLNERAAGLWEGMTRVEIDAAYPGYLADGRRPDGYESDEEIVDRAVPALLEIAATFPARRIVVVSHGGVIHALERHAAGDERDEWQRLENLEGRWFDLDGARLTQVAERIRLIDEHTPPAPEIE